MISYVLDTSALIAHLSQENGWDIVENCFARGKTAIPTIGWVEFQLVIRRAGFSNREIQKISEKYNLVLGSPLPVDSSVGKVALDLKAQIPTPIHLTDLLIAACAKKYRATLIYRDKHIEGIPEKLLEQIRLPKK